jgi:hypothetical protein
MDFNGTTSLGSNNINLYTCPMEVILRFFYEIQFQVKTLTFGLKGSDKKAKNFEILTKASVCKRVILFRK